MELTEKQILVLETVGSLQLFIQGYCEEEFEDMISFDSDGTTVVHPLQDETGRGYVNPLTYYGEDFTNSKFMDLI